MTYTRHLSDSISASMQEVVVAAPSLYYPARASERMSGDATRTALRYGNKVTQPSGLRVYVTHAPARACVCVCTYARARVPHIISRDKGANLQADEPARICFSKWLLLAAKKNGRDPKVVTPFQSPYELPRSPGFRNRKTRVYDDDSISAIACPRVVIAHCSRNRKDDSRFSSASPPRDVRLLSSRCSVDNASRERRTRLFVCARLIELVQRPLHHRW